MKFNPGQTKQIVRGVTYIKDTSRVQVNPQPINPPQVKEEPKIDQDELRHTQVEQETLPEGSESPRKPSPRNKPSSPRKSGV